MKDYSVMFCNCGCNNGVILKAEKEDNEVALTLVSNNFYTRQEAFTERLKRIWYAITGKDYCYFEILVKENELKEFKDFVSKL